MAGSQTIIVPEFVGIPIHHISFRVDGVLKICVDYLQGVSEILCNLPRSINCDPDNAGNTLRLSFWDPVNVTLKSFIHKQL